MSKTTLIPILITSVWFAVGCSGSVPPNATNNGNTNVPVAVQLDPANMPPGISASPLPPAANVPGIPANVSALTKGTTPTPGIPSEKELKKPHKPGITPTPGIPSPEELRKALGQKPTNVNAPPPTNGNPPMMMKTKKGPPGKPQ